MLLGWPGLLLHCFAIVGKFNFAAGVAVADVDWYPFINFRRLDFGSRGMVLGFVLFV